MDRTRTGLASAAKRLRGTCVFVVVVVCATLLLTAAASETGEVRCLGWPEKVNGRKCVVIKVDIPYSTDANVSGTRRIQAAAPELATASPQQGCRCRVGGR